MFRLVTHLKSITFILFFSLISILSAQAQAGKGKLAGKITDGKTGEEIIGATIVVEGSNIGASTDLDGRYFLQLEPGTYTIIVSYVSYKSKKFEGIEIKEGELNSLSVGLFEDTKELEEIVIKGEAKKESAAGLLLQQKNAVAVSSGVSAELIRKMPDRTTADVIKRVSGATIQDGKFAIIRGMQDRYNFGLINGTPLPSSEPDRKAFSLDLVPAQVIDNMVISKTATPDMPGDFAGGLIQITTRDIPDENIRFLNIGLGGHSITTMRDFYKSPQSGGTDFIGIENGSRQLPSAALSSEQALLAANNSSSNGALITEQTKLFNNDFTPKKVNAAPNISLQAGISHRAKLLNNDFGVIAALTFSNNNVYEPYERNTPLIGDPSTYRRTDTTQGFFYKNDRYRNIVNLGGILNLTYKIGQNHKVFFKNLLTQVANDQTILRTGYIYNPAFPAPYNNDKDIAYFYQSNRSYFGQLGGESILNEANKVKLNYVLGVTDIFMQVPDFKRNFSRSQGYSRIEADTSSQRNINGIPFSPGSPNNPGRFFFDLKERSLAGNADISIQAQSIRTTFKIGGAFLIRNREFTGRNFNFNSNNFYWLYDPSRGYPTKNDLYTAFLPDSNISALGGDTGRYYQVETTQKSDKYKASSRLLSAFIMGESKLTPSFRAIYGARLESYTQNISSATQGADVKKDTTWNDILPSLNLIYSLTEQVNIRFSYSRTLSRPEFREFAPLAFYDFTRNSVFVGNPGLTRARIDNFDFKAEWYPAAGQTISINPFYKNFQNPVENVIQPAQGGIAQISYQNAKGAYVYGIEFEARSNFAFINSGSKFLEYITAFGNLTLINSKVDQSNILSIADDVKNRPLQGQSPYVYNFGLQYNNDKDFNITITANQYGRRIAFVGQENKFQVWEAPRFVMDFSISKTFNKKISFKGTIGDIFSQNLIFYYDLDKNGAYNSDRDEVFEKYRRGYTVSFSAGYNF